jgi:hypothetical protein
MTHGISMPNLTGIKNLQENDHKFQTKPVIWISLSTPEEVLSEAIYIANNI